MSDKGSVAMRCGDQPANYQGMDSSIPAITRTQFPPPMSGVLLVVDGRDYVTDFSNTSVLGSNAVSWMTRGKVVTDGNPSQPCFGMEGYTSWQLPPWPVSTGTRTFSISCKHANNFSTRPRLRIAANSRLAVPETIVTAPANGNWNTLTATVSPLVNGDALDVYLEIPDTSQPRYLSRKWALWDNITVT